MARQLRDPIKRMAALIVAHLLQEEVEYEEFISDYKDRFTPGNFEEIRNRLIEISAEMKRSAGFNDDEWFQEIYGLGDYGQDYTLNHDELMSLDNQPATKPPVSKTFTPTPPTQESNSANDSRQTASDRPRIAGT